MSESTVFFIRRVAPEDVLRIYKALNVSLPGPVAVKVHSGEPGNQNFLRPDFWAPMIDALHGTVVECNTAYEGGRNRSAAHWETMRMHGWSERFPVDLLDEEGETVLEVPDGLQIKQNYVGSHLDRYASLLVLSHFKGHPMGGFGGSLKNISIGLASSHGKAYIHGAGDPDKLWTADHNAFLTSMADAACSINRLYAGKIAFINVMANMSVDCDCCAVAEDPKMKDVGILASLDPVALDSACVDLVYNSTDAGKKDLIERIESRNGTLILDAAQKLKVGTRAYKLEILD